MKKEVEIYRAVPYYVNKGIAKSLKFNSWDPRVQSFLDLGWTISKTVKSIVTIIPPTT